MLVMEMDALKMGKIEQNGIIPVSADIGWICIPIHSQDTMVNENETMTRI